jgi:hypothetical protein
MQGGTHDIASQVRDAPFLSRVDYLAGFDMGLAGEEADGNKSKAWLRGWAEAQEWSND